MKAYATGRLTQAEMAEALGMDLRSYQRVEPLVLARWALAKCAAIREVVGDRVELDPPPVLPRRFSWLISGNRPDAESRDDHLASRGDSTPPHSSGRVGSSREALSRFAVTRKAKL